MAQELTGYGTMEGVRRPRRKQEDTATIAVRFALGGIFTITCVACLMIFSWSSIVHSPTELVDKSVGKQNLWLQPVSGKSTASDADSGKDHATPIVGEPGTPKNSAGLRGSPSSEASGVLKAGPDVGPTKAGKLGFISGDRFGHDHVFRDGGYAPRDLIGDEEAHYDESDWPHPPRPEWRHAYNDYDADDEDSRRVHPYDMYLGFHPSVHYRDDRDVYSDGYGDHRGVHYDNQPNDRFGDFFHGRTEGYDWFHPEFSHEDIGPGEFAWSMDHDPVIGDEGYSRYRPNFYMDWDGSGRNMDETKTMGDEDFLADTAGAGFRAPTQRLRLVGATPKQHAEMKKMAAEIRAERARLAREEGGEGRALRVRQQQLTLRQDRNGETAAPTLGRWHGCSPQQIVGVPGDDCDPLALKMAKSGSQLAQRQFKHNTYAGVHWTSGDVEDPRLDAIPMRELHGGYSGWADIEYPADKVAPTMYKPVIGGVMGMSDKAIGTKAEAKPTLKHSRKHPNLKHADAGPQLRVQAATAQAQAAMAAAEARAEEAKAKLDVKVGDKVMADALTKEKGSDRLRLLEAATEQYQKAAQEKAAAAAAKPSDDADAKEEDAREAIVPAETEAVDEDAAAPVEDEEAAPEEAQAAVPAEEEKEEGAGGVTPAVERARELVRQESQLRKEAKALKEEEEVKVQAARDERDVVKATIAKLLAPQ